MNIFRNNNSDKITPLTMDEKIFFVKVFLQTKDIIPKDLGDVKGDNPRSLAGTPQYTLVMYLDYLYMFTMNDAFRKSVKAAATGIDLGDFSLNTNSLLKLAEDYTTTRGLPESARKEIYAIWQDNVNSSDEDSFDTFKDASYWWGDKIVEPLQIFDLVENKTREDLKENGYWDKVEHQLSLNHSLIDAYLEMRGIE